MHPHGRAIASQTSMSEWARIVSQFLLPRDRLILEWACYMPLDDVFGISVTPLQRAVRIKFGKCIVALGSAVVVVPGDLIRRSSIYYGTQHLGKEHQPNLLFTGDHGETLTSADLFRSIECAVALDIRLVEGIAH